MVSHKSIFPGTAAAIRVVVLTNGTLLFEQGQYKRHITDIALR
jgi:hypothetical protein